MTALPPAMSAQSTHPEPPLNPITPISWEGDKMFNIYIHDYCSKRGFRKTARELMQEAEISADAAPPINARQGLLFEWWSVFWVLFQAKSNGGGSEDGLVYIHHQAAQRQRVATANQMPAPLPISSQPSQPPQPPQQQPPINRLPNGMPPSNMQPGMQRPPSTYLTNGVMPNGVSMNPAMGGQPQPQPGQPMPPGATMNFGGMGPHPQQPNGMSSAGPGPVGPPQQQQPPQGMSSQSMPFGIQQSQQRPPSMMNGMSPQPRGPPNGGPFHGSPTMAHSPQHNAGTPGHSAQPGQPQPGHPQGGPGQPAMSQLGGPSPHMAPMNRVGGMMPPNGGPPGMSPMNNGQPQLQQQGPPTPGYQHQAPPNQGGRPPSRTTTPRSGMMTDPSPSLAARQTPGGPLGMGSAGQSSMGMAGGMGGNNGMMHGSTDQMNHEVMQIPQSILNSLKGELGYGDKDMSNLSNPEKQRIVVTWRQRQPKPPGMMSAPGQPGQPQQRPGQPPQQRSKRSSTSPSEEHETLPRNEASPPDRKRVRRSPGDPSGLGPMPYSTPPLPGQQQPGLPGQPGQPPMTPQQMNAMMMRSGMNGGMPIGVGGHGGGPPPPQQQQHLGLQPPQIGGPPGGMPGMMQMAHAPGTMMSPQQQQMHQQQQQQQANQQAQQQAQQQQQQAQAQHQAQQHQAQQQQFLRMQKQTGGPELTFNPGAPTGSGPPFGNRLQNKPSMSGMMPPPSPAMNGPPKDPKQDTNNGNKPPGGNPPPNGQQQPGHNPGGSPRNQPPSGPSGSSTAPPTPVPSNQPIPQQQQQQPPPPPNHPNMMSTSLLMPPSSGGLGPGDMNLFDNAFMDIGSEFDPSTLFRPDGDINFERDFGQWFNPDDAGLGASLDMK